MKRDKGEKEGMMENTSSSEPEYRCSDNTRDGIRGAGLVVEGLYQRALEAIPMREQPKRPLDGSK